MSNKMPKTRNLLKCNVFGEPKHTNFRPSCFTNIGRCNETIFMSSAWLKI